MTTRFSALKARAVVPTPRDLLVSIVVSTVLLAAGCSTDRETTSTFDGPYGPQLESAYKAETDPITKEALKDGKISRAEYEEAVQRYVACAADQGVTIVPTESYGLYTYEITGGANAEATIASCTPKIRTIESLYSAMVANPQHLDAHKVTADCLKRAKLVPRDYTGDQLAADMSAGTQPFSMDAPDVARCFTNPQADG